jgi:16S rRNA (cytidine1402-2'-O)-methyltransferase
LESVFGPQLRIVVARELTKIHEEFLRGTVADVRSELAARDRIRGEITLLIEVPAQTSSSAGGSGAGCQARQACTNPSPPALPA